MDLGTLRIRKWNQALPLVAGFLCMIQPVLDVVTYWMLKLEISNSWSTLLRLAMLLGGFCIGFLASRRKRVYIIFGVVTAAFLACHALACMRTDSGYLNCVEDLTDQARTLILPMTALTFMSLLQANRKVFPVLMRSLTVNLCFILLVMVFSTLTGTDPHTYPSKGIGVRGWFFWPSPQSAILSILSPLVIAWVLHRFPDRVLPVTLICLASFGMLFFYSTRLSTLSVPCIGLFLAVCVFFRGGKRRRIQAAAILLSALVFTALIPVSPMSRNRAALAENERIKQQRVSAAAAEYGAGTAQDAPDAAQSKENSTRNLNAIRAAYRYNLQGMIDRFGLEQVAERYAYTLDSSVICNDRIMKFRFCEMLIKDISKQTPLAILFGVELDRTRVNGTEVYDFAADDWTVGTENYDPENDVWGVFTLNGIIGILLLGGFLLGIGIRALMAVCKDRRRFTPLFAAFLAAYGIALIYAVSTASTLRRNTSSVYFAWVLAGLWYLSTCSLPEGDCHD